MYLQGILLSLLMKFYIYITSDTTGAGDIMLNNQSLERLPIPKITESNQSIADKIIALVEKILKAKEQNPQANTSAQESEIDKLVYALYNLTPEEIKIIEGK